MESEVQHFQLCDPELLYMSILCSSTEPIILSWCKRIPEAILLAQLLALQARNRCDNKHLLLKDGNCILIFSSVMTGGNLLNYHEGCFCPAGMIKSEDRTKCVSTCCLDNNGIRRKINDVWQDQNNNCTSYTCTRNGVVTQTTTCDAQNDCKESDRKWDKEHCCYTCVAQGCLDNNGTQRKINEIWQDQNNNCTSYTCTRNGVVTHTTTCAAQNDCKESDRKWDDRHCCYTCVAQGFCKLSSRKTNVTKEVQNTTCTANIELYMCEGNCASSVYFNTQTHRTERKCECCQEMETEDRKVKLTCQDGRENEMYTYPHIKSCRCKKEVCPGASTKKPHAKIFF